MKPTNVKPAEGKLGIMVVGNGAVATTFMTGVLMTRKGLAKPIGSMTQYDKMRVGRGAEAKYLKYTYLASSMHSAPQISIVVCYYLADEYQYLLFAEHCVLYPVLLYHQQKAIASVSSSLEQHY